MIRARTSNSAQLRHEFLKAWIKGLKSYTKLNKNMSISDRKKAIKLSADVAIASTSTNASAHSWSRALMANVASRDDATNRIFIEQKAGYKQVYQNKPSTTALIKCSKKILRNHVCIARRIARKRVASKCTKTSFIIANKLVEKRTRVLKRLIPGGEEMDEISLIQEALDYIASLRVQRDVMKHVVGAAETFGLFKL